MNKHLIAVAGLVGTLVFGQAPTQPPSYDTNQENEKIFRAEAPRYFDLVHTKLDLKLDFEKEHVLGKAWVTVTPHFYDSQQLTLDTKAFLVHEVALIEGKKKKPLKFKTDNWQTVIELDKIYSKGEELTIYMDYTARPNEVQQEGSAAITDAKGFYFIDPRDEDPNKPTQFWTQGETESSSCWFPTIDKPNQKTSQEISLTVPDRFKTLSNGLKTKSSKNSDGTRTDHWEFNMKHTPYLFFVGGGEYAVVEDKWRDIVVDYYVEKEYEPYARGIFGDTPDMIEFFSDLLDYDYPWQKYSSIVSRDYVSGAMENTTAVIFGDFVYQKAGNLVDENRAEAVVAHELFHHWFGDLVTTESWANLTLNESFANYSEYLWFENKYGKEYADKHRQDDLMGYRNGNNFNKNLVRVHYDSREDMFDGVSYNKGGYILHMLRSYLGDEAFFTGISNYLKENEYGKAEAAQLRIAFEETSGLDLNWFFDQWYFSNGHPKLETAYSYNTANKSLDLTIKQTQEPLFEFPLTVDFEQNGKLVRATQWVKKEKEQTLSFALAQEPKTVIVNSNNDLVCELTEKGKSVEAQILQYQLATDEFSSRYRALDILADAQATNPQALNTIIKALDDQSFHIRIKAIELLDLENPKVKELAAGKLKELAQSDKKTLVQAAALEALQALSDASVNLFEKALGSKSYSVQAAGLSGLMKLNPELAKTKISEVSEDVVKSSPVLMANIIPTWIANNDVSKAETVADFSAFYVFAPFMFPDNPEIAPNLKQGFEWVMGLDNLSLTEGLINQYNQVVNQYEGNPQVVGSVVVMVKEAIGFKSATYKKSPTDSLEKQIKLLEDFVSANSGE